VAVSLLPYIGLMFRLLLRVNFLSRYPTIKELCSVAYLEHFSWPVRSS
jgi:hypothetical protein